VVQYPSTDLFLIVTGVIATVDSCGYACSDHASVRIYRISTLCTGADFNPSIQWNSLGYPAVYPFESITQYENPNMHTAQDTTESSQFSFAHAHEFTKLVVAFVMELAL
jgi:leucyl aminopeptidase